MSKCMKSEDGNHAMWTIMRFDWPWGLLFPKVKKCLYCGAKR
jgi:hypothetical protein